ncbi:hypothetical protein Mal65_05940 [Crateriforma conspicua]|nr:hypothetical protein Mal65_05940 [Crateriforma conspicua]
MGGGEAKAATPLSGEPQPQNTHSGHERAEPYQSQRGTERRAHLYRAHSDQVAWTAKESVWGHRSGGRSMRQQMMSMPTKDIPGTLVAITDHG